MLKNTGTNSSACGAEHVVPNVCATSEPKVIYSALQVVIMSDFTFEGSAEIFKMRKSIQVRVKFVLILDIALLSLIFIHY